MFVALCLLCVFMFVVYFLLVVCGLLLTFHSLFFRVLFVACCLVFVVRVFRCLPFVLYLLFVDGWCLMIVCSLSFVGLALFVVLWLICFCLLLLVVRRCHCVDCCSLFVVCRLSFVLF